MTHATFVLISEIVILLLSFREQIVSIFFSLKRKERSTAAREILPILYAAVLLAAFHAVYPIGSVNALKVCFIVICVMAYTKNFRNMLTAIKHRDKDAVKVQLLVFSIITAFVAGDYLISK